MNEGTGLHPAGAWSSATAEDAASGLLGALPEGWAVLGRCRTGTAGPVGYPTGCWALAHPTTGVALVDVAPDATPNAEARLRRALGAREFLAGLSWLPAGLARPDRTRRMAVAARHHGRGLRRTAAADRAGEGRLDCRRTAALAEDAAWDVPGATARGPRAMPVAALIDDEDEDLPAVAAASLARPDGPDAGLRRDLRGRPGQWRDAAVGRGADAGRARRRSAWPRLPIPTCHAEPRGEPVPPPARCRRAARSTPPPQCQPGRSPQAPGGRGAAGPPQPPPGARPRSPPPAPDAGPRPAARIPGSRWRSPRSACRLPPVAPKAPVHKVARTPDRIDRACTQAVFRFQQGLALTAAEQAHVRNGCATRR